VLDLLEIEDRQELGDGGEHAPAPEALPRDPSRTRARPRVPDLAVIRNQKRAKSRMLLFS
jgi:hypothetical protein